MDKTANTTSAAPTPRGDAVAPRPGAAQPPLDLSLGHIGTTASTVRALPVAQTREDCHNWVTLAEIDTEVFAAFVGARKHALEHDFAAESGEDLEPGTLLDEEGGALHDRAAFLQVLLTGIVWRLEALAEAKGVQLGQAYDRDFGPILGQSAAQSLADQSWLGRYLGGQVRTVSAADIALMPPKERKAFKAAIRASKGKPL